MSSWIKKEIKRLRKVENTERRVIQAFAFFFMAILFIAIVSAVADKFIEIKKIDTSAEIKQTEITTGLEGKKIDAEVAEKRIDADVNIANSTINSNLKMNSDKIDADVQMHKERLEFIQNLDEGEMTKYLLSED